MKVTVVFTYGDIDVKEEYTDADFLSGDMRYFSKCLLDPNHTLTGITLTVDK